MVCSPSLFSFQTSSEKKTTTNIYHPSYKYFPPFLIDQGPSIESHRVDLEKLCRNNYREKRIKPKKQKECERSSDWMYHYLLGYKRKGRENTDFFKILLLLPVAMV